MNLLPRSFGALEEVFPGRCAKGFHLTDTFVEPGIAGLAHLGMGLNLHVVRHNLSVEKRYLWGQTPCRYPEHSLLRTISGTKTP